MPPRVVTADIEGLLGVPVLAVVAVPYRDDAPIPAPLQGGRFLDVLVQLPPGVIDASALNTHAFEALHDAPGRLKRTEEGAPLHEIWGWPHRAHALNPADEEDAAVIATTRVQPIVYDLGDRLAWRLENARPIQRGDGRIVIEALVNSPGNSANRPVDRIYDSLDAHPPELRAIVERSPWVRRETESDPPPGWGDRKPTP